MHTFVCDLAVWSAWCRLQKDLRPKSGTRVIHRVLAIVLTREPLLAIRPVADIRTFFCVGAKMAYKPISAKIIHRRDESSDLSS